MTMMPQFSDMMPSSDFSDVVVFLLSSLVTGPSFMSVLLVLITGTIFLYKRLTRNLEIGNTPTWVLPNISRLGQVWDTKFDTNVSNEMLLNAAKCQDYSFYRLCLIKGKPTGGLKLPPHTHTQTPRLGLMPLVFSFFNIHSFCLFVCLFVCLILHKSVFTWH